MLAYIVVNSDLRSKAAEPQPKRNHLFGPPCREVPARFSWDKSSLDFHLEFLTALEGESKGREQFRDLFQVVEADQLDW